MSVKPAGVAVGVDGFLDLSIALGAGATIVQVDPCKVEHLHERPIQHVDPDHRGVRIISMVMPGTVRSDDQITADGFATLALYIGVSAALGQYCAAGIGAVNMGRRDIAGCID